MLKKSTLGPVLLALCMLISFYKCGKKDEDVSPPASEKPEPIKLELVSYTNGFSLLSDSIFFRFNKKINVNYIKAKYKDCDPGSLDIHYTNNGYGFKFKYNCALLGKSYPFEYSVTDEDNKTLTGEINIDFFTRKTLDKDYSIINMLLSPDSKHIWLIIGDNDNTSSRFISLSTDSLTQEVDLPISVLTHEISYNPYNKLIYISAFRKEKIVVLNPFEGKLVKTITLKPIEGDMSEYPNIFPARIYFTKNGFGTLNVYNDVSSGSGWKVIDSSKDDRIYYQNSGIGLYTGISNGCLINDSTQIIGYLDELRKMVILDQEKKDIVKSFEVPISLTYGPAIITSKLNDIVMLQEGETAFMDLKSSKIYFYPEEVFIPWGFSNFPEKPNHFFGVKNGKIIVFDYNKGQTTFSFPLGINPVRLDVTADGKYLICVSGKDVFTFSKNMFMH